MKREKIEKECPENQERELKSQKNKLENVEIKAIGNDKKRVEREKKVRENTVTNIIYMKVRVRISSSNIIIQMLKHYYRF